MKKTTLLTVVLTVVCCGAVAEAQVYVQPANYGYTVSQPLYGAPATYAPAASYAPVTTYYARGGYGQGVAYNGNPCCNPCCNPCATSYVSASPQVAYSAPIGYAPAPAPAAYGPQVGIRRGLLGQPTVYVPGQPIRNLFRFLTP
jgi:hypothetical protein